MIKQRLSQLNLKSNLGLKLLSVVFAILLWLAVNNYDNPQITRTFRVPVSTTEEEFLVTMGKAYTIDPDTSVAVVSVTGPRKTVDDFQTSDFKATADLSQLSGYEDGVQTADIVVEASNTTIQEKLDKDDCTMKLSKLVGGKSQQLKVTLEARSDEQTYVSAETIGSPASGYAIGDLYISPNLVKVSGAQSAVSQVDHIAARVDVDGLTADTTVDANLIIYDSDGNEITDSKITLTPSVVTVNIQILATKKVPLVCEPVGTPADGYELVSTSIDPAEVTVKGTTVVLNAIDSITIPSGILSVSGATETVETEVDITPYLEEAGASLVNSADRTVTLKAEIEQLQTKQLSLASAELTVENLGNGCYISYTSANIPVTVRGRSGQLAAITEKNLKGTINARNLTVGTYQVAVVITAPNGCEVLGEVTTEITISTEEQTEPETGGNEGETGT